MDSVQKVVVPQTQVAEAKRAKKSSGMKRPKKLVKGSAATKRWMAHLRSMRKTRAKKSKTPMRKRSRKASPKKSRKAAKTPARKRSRKSSPRKGRKPGPKKGSRKGSRKGRKSSPKKK